MSSAKLPPRIPFEDLKEVSAWSIPAVGGKVIKPKAKPNIRERKKKSEETIEDVTGDVTLKPLTAEGLQEIAATVEKEACENGYQEGLQKGLQEGEAKGFAAGEKKAYAEKSLQLEQLATLLTQLTQGLQEPLTNHQHQVDNLVIDLATGFAKHLINTELSKKPELLVNIVKKAVQALPVGSSHTRIYANSHDIERLQSQANLAEKNWHFLVDDNLAPGGVRVETDESLVDYSLDARLAEYFNEVEDVPDFDFQDVVEVPDYVQMAEQALDEQPKEALEEDPIIDGIAPEDERSSEVMPDDLLAELDGITQELDADSSSEIEIDNDGESADDELDGAPDD